MDRKEFLKKFGVGVIATPVVVKTISEGKVQKGGVNKEPPSKPRPSPPRGMNIFDSYKWDDIGYVKDINMYPIQKGIPIDITELNGTGGYREFVMGRKEGIIQLEMILDNDGYEKVRNLFESGGVVRHVIKNNNAIFEFSGQVVSILTNSDYMIVDSPITHTVEIRVTDIITEIPLI